MSSKLSADLTLLSAAHLCAAKDTDQLPHDPIAAESQVSANLIGCRAANAGKVALKDAGNDGERSFHHWQVTCS